jgi:E3 ubiquitin-protein ligase DOA10
MVSEPEVQSQHTLEEPGKSCRICLGGVEDEVDLGKLISPCLCSGSMRVSALYLSSCVGQNAETNSSLYMVRLILSWLL